MVLNEYMENLDLGLFNRLEVRGMIAQLLVTYNGDPQQISMAAVTTFRKAIQLAFLQEGFTARKRDSFRVAYIFTDNSLEELFTSP